MSRKSSTLIPRRAWKILRLALVWARKQGQLRNGIILSLNILAKEIKKLRPSNEQRGALVYGDREFTFDKTPIIHVKMHRPSSMRFKMPHIPCITPNTDLDYDFDLEDDISNDNTQMGYGFSRKCFADEADEVEEINDGVDEGIDLKAEQFIAKFYEQMRMQRQIMYNGEQDMK